MHCTWSLHKATFLVSFRGTDLTHSQTTGTFSKGDYTARINSKCLCFIPIKKICSLGGAFDNQIRHFTVFEYKFGPGGEEI